MFRNRKLPNTYPGDLPRQLQNRFVVRTIRESESHVTCSQKKQFSHSWHSMEYAKPTEWSAEFESFSLWVYVIQIYK